MFSEVARKYIVFFLIVLIFESSFRFIEIEQIVQGVPTYLLFALPTVSGL